MKGAHLYPYLGLQPQVRDSEGGERGASLARPVSLLARSCTKKDKRVFPVGSPSIGLSLMEYFPSAHAPRSIKRQRSQQKGRYGFLSEYSHSRPQVGHLTLIAIFTTCCINRGGKASPRVFPRSDRCRNWRRRSEPKEDNGSQRSSESYSVSDQQTPEEV